MVFKKKKINNKKGYGYDAIPKKYKRSIDSILAVRKIIKDANLNDATLYHGIKQPEFREKTREEIFGYVCEVSERLLGMSPFPVQMMGSLILTDGDVAEMKTGEGKTLTSTMAIVYKALKGDAVYVLTTNEYLSERDAKELEPIFNAFGLTVGINKADYDKNKKKEVYNCDIIYTTNSELVFDFLRDNMVMFHSDKVNKRGLDFALIDEVDSILIDDAKTPLIISGQDNVNVGMYTQVNVFVKQLKSTDIDVDLQTQSAELTEIGVDKAEEFFKKDNIYKVENMQLLSTIRHVIQAHHIFKEGVHYNVSDGKIVLIDQSTGRQLPNNKYSNGLHQALEVKEGVEITPMTKTIANITYQNFFREFKMLSGMTGTGLTEEDEFLEIYNMRVIPVPTNKEKLRIDHPDIVFLTLEDKIEELIRYVKEQHEFGRPMLIGTASVETSEIISKRLEDEKLKHEVLNAKNHEREAEIVAKAGQVGAITVATNMAGRGTDIKISDEVRELGGLLVIGTEKHESRRIDNQLRGRSGRQGDPGEAYFIVSLEDRLVSRFLPERQLKSLSRKNKFNGQGVQSGLLNKMIDSAQIRLEGVHYDARKNVLKYGDILNTQRRLVFKEREDVLSNGKEMEVMTGMLEDVFKTLVKEDDNSGRLVIDDTIVRDLELLKQGKLDLFELLRYVEDDRLEDYVDNFILELKETFGEDRLKDTCRLMILKYLDEGWTNHLNMLDELLGGIGLRSHAQKNPLTEYQREATNYFHEMMDEVSVNAVLGLLNTPIYKDESVYDFNNMFKDSNIEVIKTS